MSLEEDIFQYLASDATLLALIGGTVETPKIYPVIAPTDAVAPHVVYMVPNEGDPDEIIDGQRITLKVTTDNYDYTLAAAIVARLNYLLDFKQRLETIPIPSSDFYIYYVKKNGGSDDKDDATKQVIKVRNYDIKFLKKSA
jgi:hypothetical protein